MSPSLSRPTRRLLAVSILLGFLWFGWSLVIAPTLALSTDREDEIALIADRLAHLRALISRQPAVEQQAGEIERRLATLGSFWEGETAVGVSASVQDAVRPAVIGSGGRIRSTSDLGESDDHGFRRIMVRFNIEGTIDTLRRTLAAIEMMKPSLFVDRLAISAPEGGETRDHPPMLTLDLLVSGYTGVNA